MKAAATKPARHDAASATDLSRNLVRKHFAVPGGPDPISISGGGSSGGSVPSQPKRILVVEDEMIAALAARELLRAAGYEVVGIVVDGAEAVRKADETRPDLVLMDIRLRGGSDGIAAAAEIRRRFDVPSLFVSAHAEPGVHDRAMKATPVGFLAKPYRPEELLGAIRKALGS